MHAGRAQQAGDVHERPAILLAGRRIHDDVGTAIAQGGAKVAAEACIDRGGGEGEASAAQLRGEPGFQSGAPRIGVYH